MAGERRETDRPGERPMTDDGRLRLAGRIASILAAALVAGCVAKGDIHNRVATINKSVGVSRNDAVLLNIVRASRDEPLYFTSLPKVASSGLITLTTGLPSLTIGPNQSNAQTNYTLTNTLKNEATSNFDVNLLESREFYDGLLRPIDLAEANLIVHQGFPRALVFSLLVDRIRITSGSSVEQIVNQPTDPATFARFQKYIYLAVYYGLAVETVTGPNGKPQDGLCFDPALAGPAQQAYVRASPIRCGTAPAGKTAKRKNTSEVVFVIDGRPQTIEILMRSPYQVFHYLGSLVDPEVGRRTVLYGDQPGASQGPMFVVAKEGYADCFARIRYGGVNYCVPNAGAENTKRIFQILNQILALNISTKDIPPTQSIYITQ